MNRDKFFLDHVFDEITFLNDYFSDLKFDDLKNDPVLQKALLKSLENIGEAVKNRRFLMFANLWFATAKNLSNNFKADNSQIEWKEIAGMRDKLIHCYFSVDLDIVYEVLRNRLPELKETVLNVLKWVYYFFIIWKKKLYLV